MNNRKLILFACVIFLPCLMSQSLQAASRAILSLNAPRGGEYLIAGQIQQVEMEVRSKVLTIKVELSRDNGVSFETIGVLDNTGPSRSRKKVLQYTASSPSSTACLIRATGTLNTGAEVSTASSNFTIANSNGSVGAVGLSTDGIADGATTNDKLAPNSVTSDKIADNSVNLSDLNTASVDARYVQKAGDDMAGTLTVEGDGQKIVSRATASDESFSDVKKLEVQASSGASVFSVDSEGDLTANSLSGSGAGITNIPAANIVGALDDSKVADNITLTNITQIINRSITDTSGDLSPDRLAGDTNDNNLVDIQVVGSGTTTLSESTAANDSGASLIGAFDEFANSNATNVQGVLKDLDGALSKSAFDAHDTTSTAIGSTFTDIPFSTQNIADTIFTHTPGSASITINATGRFKITARVSIDNTNASQRTSSDMQILKNGTAIPGTKAFGYHRLSSQGEDTMVVTRIIDITSGDVIKVQARRLSGTGTLVLIPGGNGIVIESF